MKVRPKDLIGRRIVAVDMRPFPAGMRQTNPETGKLMPAALKGMAHDPLITLDNGVKLFFVTEETEVGEYGVQICRTAVPGNEWRQKRAT